MARKLLTILVVSGLLAFYNQYGRAMVQALTGGQGSFIVDWLSLFALIALGYLIVYVFTRGEK